LTHQDQFGGAWTQQKLEVLSKYLHAYTTIFKKNQRAQFYAISYVDAFAGTGVIRRPGLGGLAELIPGLAKAEEEFRKGSVRRALEVKPPFDNYVFIEKNATKCNELKVLADEFSDRRIKIVNEDANSALLKWSAELNTKRERAVVFLDPFGTAVEWKVISALGQTRAVDLWILFPYFAINRMLVRNRKPRGAWANRLTKVFGTADWEKSFYSSTAFRSLLNPAQQVEQVYKSVDHREIIDFFLGRLRDEFEAVGEPMPLHNSRGSLLFMLFFAAGNERSAKTGIKIANSIIGL
jgi:three-Cys-motif partner protein